jgi:hypothetical protein
MNRGLLEALRLNRSIFQRCCRFLFKDWNVEEFVAIMRLGGGTKPLFKITIFCEI